MPWSAVMMTGMDYAGVTGWLAQPINAVLMILSIVIGFYHAVLGVQVIVEDYVHTEGLKFLALIFFRLFFLATGVACVFAILKVAFGK